MLLYGLLVPPNEYLANSEIVDTTRLAKVMIASFARIVCILGISVSVSFAMTNQFDYVWIENSGCGRLLWSVEMRRMRKLRILRQLNVAEAMVLLLLGAARTHACGGRCCFRSDRSTCECVCANNSKSMFTLWPNRVVAHIRARAPHLNDRRADFFFVFLREINSHVLLRLRVESHSGARRYLWPQISYRLLATIAFEWTHLFWICVFWCFQFASQLVLGPNPLNEFVRNGVSPDKNLILSIWIAKRLSNCWQTCLAGCCRHSANSTRYSATCRTHTHKATQKYNQPWFWLFGVNNIPVENTASVLFYLSHSLLAFVSHQSALTQPNGEQKCDGQLLNVLDLTVSEWVLQ